MAAPSTSVDAGSPAAFPKEKKQRAVLPYRAVGSWGVPARGRRTTVHWECEPFRHATDEDTLADVRISLSTGPGAGPVRSEVLDRTDTTDLKRRRDKAAVSASVGGAGVAYFQVALELETPNAPAGLYDSTVYVTVGSL